MMMMMMMMMMMIMMMMIIIVTLLTVFIVQAERVGLTIQFWNRSFSIFFFNLQLFVSF